MLRIVPNGTGGVRDWKQDFDKHMEWYFPAASLLFKVRIILDVVCSYFIYGSWINNYFEYRFWEKSFFKRNEFLTWRRAVERINHFNGESPNAIFRKKHIFLQEFKEYVHRDWLYLPDSSFEEMESFFKKHTAFVQKKDSGASGDGVRKVEVSDIKDWKDYYNEAQRCDYLLEEIVQEDISIAKLHSSSLNTIRILTLLDKKNNEVIFLGAILKTGNNGGFIDHAWANGVFSAIDIDTGVVCTKGMTFFNEMFIYHPYSNEKIIGLQIPAWDEVKETCIRAARKKPQVPLVGWDIIVRGYLGDLTVEIIEGNDRPGMPFIQMPQQKGIYKELKRY